MRFIQGFLLPIVFVMGCASTDPINNNFGSSSEFQGSANPPNTNCSGQNVWEQYSGTWLLTNPEVRIVFWGDWWLNNGLSQFDSMAQAWFILGNDPNFYLPLAQYGIGTGSLTAIYTANENLPSGALTENYIQQELSNEMENGTLPHDSDNSVYVIELPPTATSARDVGIAIGHHGDYQNMAYAVIDYSSDVDQMNWVSSHEIYEAATDPTTYTGWWGGSGETEVGDLCVGHNYVLDGYVIQQVWDQQHCVCGP